MKDSRYYFLLGFATAILIAVVISCGIAPLEANMDQECGQFEWKPCYVRIVP
tara:strand:+ start:928 stop:1083 length:156 start_codon:yes stop_codon:yes gene_type:complete